MTSARRHTQEQDGTYAKKGGPHVPTREEKGGIMQTLQAPGLNNVSPAEQEEGQRGTDSDRHQKPGHVSEQQRTVGKVPSLSLPRVTGLNNESTLWTHTRDILNALASYGRIITTLVANGKKVFQRACIS